MERKNFVASVITQTGDGIVPYISSAQGGIGSYQYISNLNNGPYIRTPGVFRANPVVMWKSSSIPKLGRSVKSTYASQKNYRIEGDLCGYLQVALGCTPAQLVQYNTYWDSAKATQAQNRAFASAAAPDLDLGVQLGELKETLAGLITPLGSLRKFINQYNKLYKTRVPGVRVYNTALSGNRADGLSMLSGSWLEWRYAVRPLIKTIYDIMEHVESQNRLWSGKMLRKAGKVKGSKALTLTGGVYPGYFYLAGSCRVEIEWKYNSKLYFREDAPLSWQHKYGIDGSNLLPVAWEIVPLSFIVDRFVNIGDWLAAIKFYNNRRTVLGMVTSCKTTMKGRTFLTSLKHGTTTVAMEQDPSVDFQIEHLDRRVIYTPSVSWTPTTNLAHHSLSMLLDELTLIWQRMPKIRR